MAHKIDVSTHAMYTALGEIKQASEEMHEARVKTLTKVHRHLSRMDHRLRAAGMKAGFGTTEEDRDLIIGGIMKKIVAANETIRKAVVLVTDNATEGGILDKAMAEEAWGMFYEGLQKKVGNLFVVKGFSDYNTETFLSKSGNKDSEAWDDHLNIPDADTVIRLDVGSVSSSVEGIPYVPATQKKTRITISFSHYVTKARETKFKVSFQWYDHGGDSNSAKIWCVTYRDIGLSQEEEFRREITHLKNSKQDDFTYISFESGKISLKTESLSPLDIIVFDPSQIPHIQSENV